MLEITDADCIFEKGGNFEVGIVLKGFCSHLRAWSYVACVLGPVWNAWQFAVQRLIIRRFVSQGSECCSGNVFWIRCNVTSPFLMMHSCAIK